MATHFLGLQRAETLETPGLVLAREAIETAAHRRAIVVLHGEAGTGKTFAVEQAVGGLSGVETHILKFPSRASRKRVVLQVLSVTTEVAHEGDAYDLVEDAFEVLSERPRLLVVDEAQELSWDGIEFLRHLYDDRDAQFGLAFVGASGCWDLIARYPPLESRVLRDVPFVGLSRAEVRDLIPRFHPIYENTQSAVIDYINEVFAKGNLRKWARFTLDAVDVCEAQGLEAITNELATQVFALQRGLASTNPASAAPRPRQSRYRRRHA